MMLSSRGRDHQNASSSSRLLLLCTRKAGWMRVSCVVNFSAWGDDGRWMIIYIYILLYLYQQSLEYLLSLVLFLFYLCLWFWGVMVDLGRERFSPICWILDDAG